MQLGIEMLSAQAPRATLDEDQSHRILLQSRVALESLRASMLSQCLCGTEIPDSAHIVHQLQMRDRNGDMQCVWGLANSGATSILVAPRLLRQHGISHEAADITTLGSN